MNDFGSVLAGQAPQQMVSAPSVAQPGGGPQEPQDPTMYESAVVSRALEQLAELFGSYGDEESKIKVQRMELELNRIRQSRQKRLSQGFRDVQATILPQMM